MDRDLTSSCSESKTFQSEDITDIRFLEICIRFFSDRISCYIDLNIALQVLDITERSFTHDTLEHHTSGDSYMDRTCIHDLSSFFIVLLENFSCLCFIKTFHIRSLAVL